MGRSELIEKSLNANLVSINVRNVFWRFHKFKTKSSSNPALASIKKQFKEEPVGVPDFYRDVTSAYIAKLNNDTFVLGSIDLFITNSKAELKEAILEKVQGKLGLEEVNLED